MFRRQLDCRKINSNVVIRSFIFFRSQIGNLPVIKYSHDVTKILIKKKLNKD